MKKRTILSRDFLCDHVAVNGVGKIQFETLIVFSGLFGKIIKKSLGVEGYDYLLGICHILSPTIENFVISINSDGWILTPVNLGKCIN